MMFFRMLFARKAPRAMAPAATRRGNFEVMLNPICLLVDGATRFMR